MLKNCGACSKLVYPVDELRCLDKTWHKLCFKCQVCSMTLNMKNYKGYNKLPYCNAHYPTTKHTVVADTPENRRIAKNTKVQSNIAYHAEFEKSKDKFTAVADDPETLRIRKNMATISNVAYHGDLARKEAMENARPTEVETTPDLIPTPTQQRDQPSYQPAPRRQPGSIHDYDPDASSGSAAPVATQATTVFSSSGYGQARAPQPRAAPQPAAPEPARAPSPVRQPEPVRAPSPVRQPEPVRAPSPVRQPEPVVRAPSPVREPSPEPIREPTPEPVYQPEPAQEVPRELPTADPYAGKGNVSKALYDYAAGDDDEVGFEEDDIIIQCDPIDDGWMMGTVEKTGQTGMLPSNYVEKLNW